jgi:hypothetical protein
MGSDYLFDNSLLNVQSLRGGLALIQDRRRLFKYTLI